MQRRKTLAIKESFAKLAQSFSKPDCAVQSFNWGAGWDGYVEAVENILLIWISVYQWHKILSKYSKL